MLGVFSGCGTGELTAEQVVNELRANSLAVNNPRDNTAGMCGDLQCSQLITTDDVSVYMFSDPVAQQRWVDARGDDAYSRGNVVLSFAPDQVQGPQQDPYRAVLDSLTQSP